MGEVNDGNGYDEDLAKLEAARAALTAELNGEQEDHYVGHQGDGNLQQLAQLQEVSYSLAEAKQAAMQRKIRGGSDMGLAITIKGDKDGRRSVADSTQRKSRRKFEEEAPKSRSKDVISTGSIGLIANYGSNGNTDSEEEGEIDREERPDRNAGLDDELLEYAMNEDGGYPSGNKQHSEGSFKSYEREYEEFKKKKDKDKKKEREKKDREREKKAAEKREKQKRKEKERREKELKKKEKEESKRNKERKESEIERSRYGIDSLCLFHINDFFKQVI